MRRMIGMGHRRTSVVLMVAAGVAVLWAAFHFTWRGIILRTPKADPTAERYTADLARTRGKAGPGLAVSADGRFLAFDTRAARSYHTINVWDRWTEEVTPVVSVQEMDPGSGSSHGFTWSADSRALLISGSGGLPFRQPGKLCFVYLPAHRTLHEVRPCG
jgi:hypothetical protein